MLQADQHGGSEASSVAGPVAIGQDAGVSFNRIAWLLTVAAALITALLLLISGYNGYGAVAIAVGLSAAINLVPEKTRPPGPPPT
ncbi:MAG: hypothetical protein QOI64_404 [Solirubrobacteraceae bacterium]|nr:hypothetical protein [Solirubrobacteraceae bacterium]